MTKGERPGTVSWDPNSFDLPGLEQRRRQPVLSPSTGQSARADSARDESGAPAIAIGFSMVVGPGDLRQSHRTRLPGSSLPIPSPHCFFDRDPR